MSQMFFDNGPVSDGHKVMLASTVYDSPDASYTFSIAKSRQALTDAGIQSSYLLLSGNCHVDDARNSVVHEFMQSDCDDLVFLDADVSWQAEDLVKLCRFDCDLVGGVYPYRREDAKARRGMPFMALEGEAPENGLLRVSGLPTGFMRIKRRVFDVLLKDTPTFDSKDKKKLGIPLLFERVLKKGTRWGGDINFCLKWIAAGGEIYAATDFVLGHACKTVLKGSLGAHLRRENGTTLRYVADRIRGNEETAADFLDAFEFMDNPWGASDELLIIAVAGARKAQGPIIETGSGLTSVLMAAATDQTVYCLEHSEHFANQTRAMAYAAGVSNIAIVHCGIAGGWYDIEDDLVEMPKHYGFGLNDGPPRQLGDRMRFFDVFGDKCDIILSDDANEAGYADRLTTWAESKGREIAFPEFRSAIMMKAA